jgi:hypothetical protein
MQIDVIMNLENLSEDDREQSAVALIGKLANTTKPRDGGFFPQDLNISITILESTIFQQVF